MSATESSLFIGDRGYLQSNRRPKVLAWQELVQCPQPALNAIATLNQKQLILLKVFIDEVAVPTPLLLNI